MVLLNYIKAINKSDLTTALLEHSLIIYQNISQNIAGLFNYSIEDSWQFKNFIKNIKIPPSNTLISLDVIFYIPIYLYTLSLIVLKNLSKQVY